MARVATLHLYGQEEFEPFSASEDRLKLCSSDHAGILELAKGAGVNVTFCKWYGDGDVLLRSSLERASYIATPKCQFVKAKDCSASMIEKKSTTYCPH